MPESPNGSTKVNEGAKILALGLHATQGFGDLFIELALDDLKPHIRGEWAEPRDSNCIQVLVSLLVFFHKDEDELAPQFVTSCVVQQGPEGNYWRTFFTAHILTGAGEAIDNDDSAAARVTLAHDWYPGVEIAAQNSVLGKGVWLCRPDSCSRGIGHRLHIVEVHLTKGRDSGVLAKH